MPGVGGGKVSSQLQGLYQPGVCQPIPNAPAVFSCLDVTAPAQTGQMRRDTRLGKLEEVDQLTHGPLAFDKQRQDPKAGAVPNPFRKRPLARTRSGAAPA